MIRGEYRRNEPCSRWDRKIVPKKYTRSEKAVNRLRRECEHFHRNRENSVQKIDSILFAVRRISQRRNGIWIELKLNWTVSSEKRHSESPVVYISRIETDTLPVESRAREKNRVSQHKHKQQPATIKVNEIRFVWRRRRRPRKIRIEYFFRRGRRRVARRDKYRRIEQNK